MTEFGAIETHDEMVERKCTNISSLFFCMGFVILLFGLVGYSAYYGNLDRLTLGFDDCGNICGELNDESDFDQCGSHDKRGLPKLLAETKKTGKNLRCPNCRDDHRDTELHYKCVEKCPLNYDEIFNRCFEKSSKDAEVKYEELSSELVNQSKNIAAVCLIAFVFSYILLILFRYAIKYIIWIVYCSFIVLMIAGALFFFAHRVYEMAILLFVFAIISISLLYYFRKKIILVAKLFKEASKALIEIPGILFEPILTFLSLLIAFVLFIYFAIVIETSGKLTKDHESKATFEKDAGMQAAQIVNVIAFIWFTQFLYGCQHFIIAGTISKWYFTRDKTKLQAPIQTTFSHLINFHLGSVCLGSMIITLIKILKMIMKAVQRDMQRSNSLVGQIVACCCVWLIEMLENFLKFLVRNTYIIIAKEGTPFVESGKRAYQLIFRNLMNIVALNHFGDLVLVLGRLFIVVIVGLFGYALMSNGTNDVFVPFIIACLFAFLIAHCFISVFEMTVDTIFICFCIDYEENDGVTRPYYMSDSLKKVFCEMKEFSGEQFEFDKQNMGQYEQPMRYDDPEYGGGAINYQMPPYPITNQDGYAPYQNQPPPPYHDDNTHHIYPAIDAENYPIAPTAPYPPQQPNESGYLLNKGQQSYSTNYNQNW